jgi:signal transduction histidine kinase
MKRVILVVAMGLIAILATYAEHTSDNVIPLNDESLIICKVSAQPEKVHYSIAQQGADFFSLLVDTSSWPPRWQCGEWSSFHGWLYILSDLTIWLSYFLIPLTLGYFVYKRKKSTTPFKSIIFLFIAFILACGISHLIDAVIFWWPAYRLSALIRFATAGVSMGTVFALVQIAPKVIELKSPEMLEKLVAIRTAELQGLNLRLQEEVNQRERAEQKLVEINLQLEEKSKGLEEMNSALIQRERDLMVVKEKIDEMNLQLEKKVEERTQELHTTNHELEAFTYSVSHDLRAPLRAIDGYARILAEDYDSRIDSQGKHLINVITKNAKYMGQLIDDLLEFSRTSRTTLNRSVFLTTDEVKRLTSELLIHEKGRDIEIEFKTLEPIKGDTNMLRQVWINLLSNALKYTSKKSNARIEIGSVLYDDEVKYYVKDNGVGFDMEYVDKLFGIFQRLHKKEEFPGTGVGLALVKRILDRHEGKIWAEAELNYGAVFYFTLPR